jgi:hypothetical protein
MSDFPLRLAMIDAVTFSDMAPGPRKPSYGNAGGTREKRKSSAAHVQ